MDNINNWVADGSYRSSKWIGTVKQLFWYWLIKFNNVKLCKTWLVIFWKQLKPIYDSGSVSPVVGFDDVCNIPDHSFQMFFANKS